MISLPFSNGTDFMHWYDQNCGTCVRAFVPANGKNLPDFDATQRLVNLGRECRMKFAVDLGIGGGTGEVPDDIAALMGLNGDGTVGQCMMHSDDDNDRWKPGPRKPPPEDDRQLMLFSIVDDVLAEQENLVKEYA